MNTQKKTGSPINPLGSVTVYVISCIHFSWAKLTPHFSIQKNPVPIIDHGCADDLNEKTEAYAVGWQKVMKIHYQKSDNPIVLATRYIATLNEKITGSLLEPKRKYFV